MSSEFMPGRYTIGELIKNGTILGHKDGNFGSYYPKITDFGDVGVPLITAKVINNGRINFSEAQKLSFEKANSLPFGFIEENDVLLSHNATVGRVAIVPRLEGRVLIGTSLTYFRVNKERLLPHYLGAFFESRDFQNQLEAVMGLSTRNQVPITAQRLLTIEVPSLAVQTEIANCIQALDNRLNLLRETNATLEAIAQALFKSWFVDFDPVHANAGTQAPSLPPEIQALFPTTFTDSPRGPIPEGWEWRDLADVTEILNGFAFKSEDYVSKEDGIFVLRTTNFSDSGFAVKLEKDVHLPESFLESHKKYLCQPFDFHLVMVGASVGHTSLLLPHLLPAFRNQNMWCFREKTGFPSKFFIHEVVKANITDALRSTSGSAREFFRKGDFGARKVLVPNNSVLSIFEEHVSLLKGRLAVNSEKIEYLSETRDTLLPRLISGQLRLPEADQAIAAITD